MGNFELGECYFNRSYPEVVILLLGLCREVCSLGPFRCLCQILVSSARLGAVVSFIL